MSEIPEDIQQAAKKVSDRLFRVGEFINSHVCRDPIELIARAILAERERCADVADKIDQPGIPGTGEWLSMGNFAAAIRDAILEPPVTP